MSASTSRPAGTSTSQPSAPLEARQAGADAHASLPVLRSRIAQASSPYLPFHSE